MTSQPTDDFQNWRVESEPALIGSHGLDLLTFVKERYHLKEEGLKNYYGYINIHFDNKKLNVVGTIRLHYDDRDQSWFEWKLGLAVLGVTSYCTLRPGTIFPPNHPPRHQIADFFASEIQNAFFKILETLNFIYGRDSIPGFGIYPGEVGYEIYMTQWPRDVIMVHQDVGLLMIGSALTPYIGLDKLRNTHTFAKWELNNNFIFASPFYFYAVSPIIQPTIQLSADNLWKNQTQFESMDEFFEAIDLNEKILKEGLGLPLQLPYTSTK